MWLKNLLLLITLCCLVTTTLSTPRVEDDYDDYGEDRGHHKKKRRRRPCFGGNGKDANGKTLFDWNLYYSDVNYNYNYNQNINCGGNGGNNGYKPTLTGQQASHPLLTQLAGQFGNGGGGFIPPGGIGNFQGLFSSVGQLGQNLGSGIQSVVAGNGGGGSGGGFGSGSGGGSGGGFGFGSILGSPASGGNGGAPAGGGGLGFFGQNGLFDFSGGWLNSQRPPGVPNRPISNDPVSPPIVAASDDVVHDVPNDPVIEDNVHENANDNVAANGNQYWKPGQYVGAYNPAIGGYYQNFNNVKPNKVIHKINRQFNKIAKPFYDLFFRRR